MKPGRQKKLKRLMNEMKYGLAFVWNLFIRLFYYFYFDKQIISIKLNQA